MRARLTFALACAALCSACANKPVPLYQWDTYQRQLYEAMKGDGVSPNEQMTALQAQESTARSKGLALPPGFRAHKGIVLLRLGQTDEARQQFEAEKLAFPESGTYMDFVLKSMSGGKS